MGREDVEVIRQAYAALGRGDFDAALDAFHDDAEHDWSRALGPYAGTYYGRAAAKRFWLTAWQAVERVEFDVEEAIETGANVVAHVRVEIVGAGSQIAAEARGFHVWTMRDGKTARFRLFQTRADALEAVAQDEAAGGAEVERRDRAKRP